jgi:hypothetical protein
MACGQNLGMRPPGDLKRLWRRQVHDRHAQELVARITYQLTECAVGMNDSPIQIDHGERLWTQLQ